MKKLIVSGAILIASFLSFSTIAGSPYASCKNSDGSWPSNSQFCQCFYNNCNKVFPGQCQYARLVAYFNKITPAGACSVYPDKKECTDGINHFEQVCN